MAFLLLFLDETVIIMAIKATNDRLPIQLRKQWEEGQALSPSKLTPKERFGSIPRSNLRISARLGSPSLRTSPFRGHRSDKIRKELLAVEENEHKGTPKTKYPPLPSPRSTLKSAHSLSPRHFPVTPRHLSAKVTVSACFAATETGSYHGQAKVNNQDSSLVCRLEIPSNPHLFLVCDGHGEFGHLVSSFVTHFFPCALLEEVEGKEGNRGDLMQKAVHQAFEQTNEALKHSQINIDYSGSTCVSILIAHNLLICGNVGDSRAILGRISGKSLTFFPLSQDHKPDLPVEKQRIQAAGGRVTIPHRFPTSCARVWQADFDSPGLSMSRALGDQRSAEIGIIPTPDVVSARLCEGDLFVILASDGVWEFVSSQEAVEVVYERQGSGQSGHSAQALVDLAANRWKERSNRSDDITAIVVFLG